MMIFSVNPVIMFTLSGLILKIFLVVSVLVLAIYIFVLEGRNFLVESILNKLKKKQHQNQDKKIDLQTQVNFDFEVRKLRILKILWVIITILSAVIFFTYN